MSGRLRTAIQYGKLCWQKLQLQVNVGWREKLEHRLLERELAPTVCPLKILPGAEAIAEYFKHARLVLAEPIVYNRPRELNKKRRRKLLLAFFPIREAECCRNKAETPDRKKDCGQVLLCRGGAR